MIQTDPDRSKPSVLLIAEDVLLLCDLAMTLEQIGYGVVLTSVDVALALNFVKAPDVVLIDVADIKRADALEVGDWIGGRSGSPVVYLVDDDDQASRIGAEAAPFLMWPFAPSALEDTLERALVAETPRRGAVSESIMTGAVADAVHGSY